MRLLKILLAGVAIFWVADKVTSDNPIVRKKTRSVLKGIMAFFFLLLIFMFFLGIFVKLFPEYTNQPLLLMTVAAIATWLFGWPIIKSKPASNNTPIVEAQQEPNTVKVDYNKEYKTLEEEYKAARKDFNK